MVLTRVIYPLFGNSFPSDVATFSLDQSSSVDTMAWSPDGTHFAAAIEEYDASTGGNRTVVQVWEVASGHLVTTFSGHPSNITALAWSGDGREIVSGSASQEQQGTPGTAVAALIQVWNATTGQTVATYRGHSADNVDALSWAPDGHAIVSSGLDWLAPSANSSDQPGVAVSVVEWNMSTHSEGARYDTQNIQLGNVTGLAWSPDGKYVAAAGQGLVLWNAATGTLRWSSNTSEEQVAWSPDSRYLVSYGVDQQYHASGGAFNGPYVSEIQRIKVWDAATDKNISTMQTGGLDAMDLVWLPGGKIAAVLYNPQGGSTGTVSVWNVLASGQLGSSPCTNRFPFTQDETTTGTNHTHLHFYVQHAQLSPDGKRLAVAWSMQGRNIDVWQVGCIWPE
jgi:WD40 repeat protein